MEYKLLEQIGVDNENIDGAAFNNFVANGEDGIIREVLNECAVYSPTSNAIAINTGEMLVHGFRVKITEAWTHTFTATPTQAVLYQIVARITLNSDRGVAFDILCREKQNLQKTPLFSGEEGVYETEIAQFTHTAAGEVSDIVRIMKIIRFDFDYGELRAETKQLQKGKLDKETSSDGKVYSYVYGSSAAGIPVVYGAETTDWTDEVLGDSIVRRTGEGNVYGKNIVENTRTISKHTRDIQTLYSIAFENGLYTVIEVEQAFTARETANGEHIVDNSIAEVKKVTGKTVKTTNLIPFPYSQESKTESGVTFTSNVDGSVIVNGTCENKVYFSLATFDDKNLFAGAYTISGEKGSVHIVVDAYNDSNWVSTLTTNGAFTVDWSNYNKIKILLYINTGETISNVTVYPMLNEGDAAEPFIPYFSGLKNSYFKGIKTTGRNLVNPIDVQWKHGTFSADGSISFSESAYSLVSELIPIPQAGDYFARPKDFTGINLYWGLYAKDKQFIERKSGAAITLSENVKYVRIYLYRSNSSGLGAIPLDMPLQISYGSSVLDFESYTKNTFEFSEAIELGLGTEIDFKNQKIVETWGEYTFTGQEIWSGKNGSYNTDVLANLMEYSKGNGICDRFPLTFFGLATPVKGIAFGSPSEPYRIYMWIDGDKDIQEETKGMVVRYPMKFVKETPFTEAQKAVGNEYLARKHGSEKIIQGDTDNSEYGAMPTATIEYFKLGGTTNEE